MKRLARNALLLATVFASGCRGMQSVLDVAGVHAKHIELMWNTMLWVCGVMYALVMIFLIGALMRARRTHAAAQTTGATASTASLTQTLRGWMGLVIVGLLGLTLTSYAVDRKLFLANQEGLTLEVTGQQWWWNVKYQNDDDPSQSFQTANEIHLPVDRPVHIQLRSTDVIHSFWVPNLHGKQDLIPGRDNQIYLWPTKTGRYRGQCAEFCGAQHANMAMYVIVESQQAFDRWRSQQLQPAAAPGDDTATHGQNLFMTSACPLCHTIRGTDAAGTTGPDLTHLASRQSLAAGTLLYNRGNLAGWLTAPQSVKPGNHMPRVAIDPGQFQALVTYLDGLH